MSRILVTYVSGFRNEDVVLLAVDADGRDEFLAALTEALRDGTSRLERLVRPHEFVMAAGAADVELGDDHVLWRLDPAKAAEIVEKGASLGADGRAGHHYVDEMHGPAATLVLSLDEYLAPSWLTAGKEPIFGDDDPD